MKHTRTIWYLMVLLVAGCTPFRQFGFYEQDLKPPMVMGVQAPDANTLVVRFDEEARLAEEAISLEPSNRIEHFVIDDELRITLAEPTNPGVLYRVGAAVEDEQGNSMSFVIDVYGFNPALPGVVITEFTTNGTKSNPDKVELFVLRGGNLGGLTIFEGSPSNWQDRLVFSAVEVAAGDYIVVHFRPAGTPDEVNERVSWDESAAEEAIEGVWDWWVPEGNGLSGNNGVITVTANPGGGEVLDSVIYSNRSSTSDERYRGFGSKDMVERVDEIVALGAWQIEAEQAVPEDAVSSIGTTSTRSVSRSSDASDSDSRADWHITPTRGATFGAPNSDEVYMPK